MNDVSPLDELILAEEPQAAPSLPDAYGVHDMIGNVWEWTTDWFAQKHEADAPKACYAPENPRSAREARAKKLDRRRHEAGVEEGIRVRGVTRGPLSRFGGCGKSGVHWLWRNDAID